MLLRDDRRQADAIPAHAPAANPTGSGPLLRPGTADRATGGGERPGPDREAARAAVSFVQQTRPHPRCSATGDAGPFRRGFEPAGALCVPVGPAATRRPGGALPLPETHLAGTAVSEHTNPQAPAQRTAPAAGHPQESVAAVRPCVEWPARISPPTLVPP